MMMMIDDAGACEDAHHTIPRLGYSSLRRKLRRPCCAGIQDGARNGICEIVVSLNEAALLGGATAVWPLVAPHAAAGGAGIARGQACEG